MVPDRWETVWRTLVLFGILVHITSDRGSAIMHWIIIVEVDTERYPTHKRQKHSVTVILWRVVNSCTMVDGSDIFDLG